MAPGTQIKEQDEKPTRDTNRRALGFPPRRSVLSHGKLTLRMASLCAFFVICCNFLPVSPSHREPFISRPTHFGGSHLLSAVIRGTTVRRTPIT
jgi:hypothetical protein